MPNADGIPKTWHFAMYIPNKIKCRFCNLFCRKLDYSWDQLNFEKIYDMKVVAIQPKHQIAYSKIDFGDFVTANNTEDAILINLQLNHLIEHTFPKIDRCCRLKDNKVEFDGVDNMERIDCSLDQEEFTKKYVNQREAIMMKGRGVSSRKLFESQTTQAIGCRVGLSRVISGFDFRATQVKDSTHP